MHCLQCSWHAWLGMPLPPVPCTPLWVLLFNGMQKTREKKGGKGRLMKWRETEDWGWGIAAGVAAAIPHPKNFACYFLLLCLSVCLSVMDACIHYLIIIHIIPSFFSFHQLCLCLCLSVCCLLRQCFPSTCSHHQSQQQQQHQRNYKQTNRSDAFKYVIKVLLLIVVVVAASLLSCCVVVAVDRSVVLLLLLFLLLIRLPTTEDNNTLLAHSRSSLLLCFVATAGCFFSKRLSVNQHTPSKHRHIY